MSRKLDIAVAEARLRAAIARLEQDIWIYHLVYLQDATEPADTPFGQAADDALPDIRAQQTSLSVSYAELKDLVKEQPELLEALIAGFDTDVTTLAGWDAPPPTFDDRSGNAPRVTGTRPRSGSRWRWADDDAESPR